MNLVEHLKENWDKSSFMKISLNQSIRKEIEESTRFLNQYYSSVSLRTRAYVLVNEITENTIPKCKCNCG